MTEAIRGNVLVAVAEMESKMSDNAENAKTSQKDIQQEIMKKALAKTLQDIENNARDRLSGLEDIKRFLSHLSTEDLGTDVNAYVKNELDSANSYHPDQDLINKLKEDEENLKYAKEGCKADQDAIAALDKKIADLVKTLANAEDKLKHGSFWERIGAYFEIVGLDIALGALEVAKGVVWLDEKMNESRITSYQESVNQDNQALANDPKILNCLGILSTGGKLATNQANQKISAYQTLVNDATQVENTISAMVKLFQSA